VLDGIRGLAIISVLMCHVGGSSSPGRHELGEHGLQYYTAVKI
jgi:hypothetical protein